MNNFTKIILFKQEVGFEVLMKSLLPVDARHVTVRDNYVDELINLVEGHFIRVSERLVTLSLIRLRIATLARLTFRLVYETLEGILLFESSN